MAYANALGVASTALRSRGHIFTLRFIRALRKRARNSVRIIAITRINLHFELPSCKPRLTRATCYYSQMKSPPRISRVSDKYRFSHRARANPLGLTWC